MSTHAPIPVVAAVIRRGNRYLVGRRPPEKRHGGLWEFPGGKLDHGETLREAAARELSEELELVLTATGRTLLRKHDVGAPFEIVFVEVEVESAEPVPHEHTEVGWFTAEELGSMELAPSDAAFVAWVEAGGAR